MKTLFTQQFKKLILPLQLWLLSQGRCVGCGKDLTKVGTRKTKKTDEELVTCECGRVYVYNKKNKIYRRALLKEI